MKKLCHALALAASLVSFDISADSLIDGPRLKPESRISQSQIVNGELNLRQIRKTGLLIFSTPFNKQDGFGDGPYDALTDNRAPEAGNRPMLQGNGTFLRVNGLDAQTCLECHTIVSNATVPATLGVGGVGGINSSPMFMPDEIEVGDEDKDGIARFTGRLINPPFLFGSGGVELVGREMTKDLQDLKQQALNQPGTVIPLIAKNVDFGSIVADAGGNLDTSQVKGVSEDLIIRPFGRKGEFASVREFDISAMAFHLGMQAVELVGHDIDGDQDGVVNEMTEGDLSALSIFNTTMDRPVADRQNKETLAGFELFNGIGCTGCHIPAMTTHSKYLKYKLTDSPDSPFENTFYEVDLTKAPMNFRVSGSGVEVPFFSDLKRHDMGEGLKESFNLKTDKENREFITARLWGVADTAPYLHDGRALTLAEAIAAHNSEGSEAAPAAEQFENLSVRKKSQLLKFLMTLRTPKNPNADVLNN
ncbi:MAG: di-heme oxidoredictase family protein [Gammaproteobacteria bacterium]